MTPAPRTAFDRDAAFARLAGEEFDVLVIGGGITGAGVALDAASRGLRTALVERDDFGSGTSSKSSKLVHGGLRYLQQKEYLLVYENLRERQRLLDNAPHLVSPLPFVIPLFGRDGVTSKAVAKAYSTALWLYDLTGGVRIGRRHRRLAVDEVIEHLPTLRRELVTAGFLYWDARADDARLTLTVLRTAALNWGAVAANYAAVTDIVKQDGRVQGAVVTRPDGPDVTVRAHVVINATGVWADEVRALDAPAEAGTLSPAKGIHLTLPKERLPCDMAVVVPVPKDRRSIFVVPWNDRVYVGTTDTPYEGSLDEPRCTTDDVAYCLGALNTFFTGNLTERDVVGTWAGLRPLLKGAGSERTADLSRRHAVTEAPSGLITITGGKLTTYRKMAEDAVDVATRRLGVRRRCATKRLRLRGVEGRAPLVEDGAAARLGIEKPVLDHLLGRYGGEARTLLAMLEADPELVRPLVAGLPYLRAEAVYAIRYEMARHLDDVLLRRTRAALHDAPGTAAAAHDVARLLASELGWDPRDTQREADAVRDLLAVERGAAGLPA
jgi:glycerol-3-phosphate dehydrogenase